MQIKYAKHKQTQPQKQNKKRKKETKHRKENIIKCVYFEMRRWHTEYPVV